MKFLLTFQYKIIVRRNLIFSIKKRRNVTENFLRIKSLKTAVAQKQRIRIKNVKQNYISFYLNINDLRENKRCIHNL